MKNKLDGWLILDKPLGITSAHAVAKVKRLLKPEKIGHAGTLDPLASGILPLALGEATKTVQYAMDGSKTYHFTLAFGEARSTDDREGAVTATSPIRPTLAQLEAILPRFTGQIRQIPPAYSALHIGGQRAYQLARAGEEVILEPREIEIFSLTSRQPPETTNQPLESAQLTAICGKGAYIRSLARDIAAALGTCGHVSTLHRASVGKFTESHAISLENLENMVHKDALATVLHPVASVLDDIPAREISSTQACALRNGQFLPLVLPELPDGTLLQALSNGELIAICNASQGLIKPVRVFNLMASASD